MDNNKIKFKLHSVLIPGSREVFFKYYTRQSEIILEFSTEKLIQSFCKLYIIHVKQFQY